MDTIDLHQCRQLGRIAFRKYGVSGEQRHAFPRWSRQRQEYLEGFDEARNSAIDASLKEAAAYDALSRRDNVKDRAWAARLLAA